MVAFGMRVVEWTVLLAGLVGCSTDSSALTHAAGGGGASGSPVEAGASGGASSGPCRNSLDCASGLICDRTQGRCVECITASDCRTNDVCANSVCRSTCQSDKDCTGLGLLCDRAAGNCVECLLDVDCPSGKRCTSGVCGAGSGGGAGAGGASGAGAGGASGAGAVFGLGGSGGIVGCQGQVFDTTQSPLDMAVLLDQSGSMGQSTTGAGTKWALVSQAFDAFLNAPENANVGVALGYFPLTLPGVPAFCSVDADCGNYGPCVGGINVGGMIAFGSCQQADVCTVSSYAAPEVPFALPPNPTAAVASLAQHTPGGGTPTTPALEGMMQYATAWATQHPERKVVVVLATDGDPTGCTTNTVQDVANIATSALASSGIATYVVGVGSSLTSLNQIAQAGGTTQAYLLDTTADLGTAFQSAMNQIRTRSTPCSFPVPPGVTDSSRINVLYTPPGSSAPTVIPRVQSACGTAGGWQFDAGGTRIVVCPSTCSSFALGGGVQVESGCATVVGP